MEVKRWIGIRPRIKGLGSEDNPPRPTEVCIITGDGTRQKIQLETEQDELDFILGYFPTGWRDVSADDNISAVPTHLVIHDDAEEAKRKGRLLKPAQIPSGYIGLQAGDLVGMSLGGLGDLMAYSISRNGEKGGFIVKRLPPYKLKEEREERKMEKGDDAELLAVLIQESQEIFRDLAKRDRAMVKLRETVRLRNFLQDDRKACAMRVRESVKGNVFCSEEGGYPEGGIEKVFDLALASDPVLMALEEKEERLNKQLKSACEELPIYQAIKPLVTGAGPSILGRFLASVQDIGLFATPGKMKAFCGLHVMPDGSFPRKRVGVKCNWNPNSRQAFFLLGDQFNRRPGTFWGDRLIANKAEYKRKHPHPTLTTADGRKYPLIEGRFKKKGTQYTISGISNQSNPGEPVTVSGKQEHFNGHLHKMAIWRTLGQFAEWLYWKWRTLEGYPARIPRFYPPEDEAEIKKQREAQMATILATANPASEAV